MCYINLVAPTILTVKKKQCALLQGYFKRIIIPKKMGTGPLSSTLWAGLHGPSLRDHLVKFFYRLSHVPAQAKQGNLPPSIKMGLSVCLRTIWWGKFVPTVNLHPISRSAVFLLKQSIQTFIPAVRYADTCKNRWNGGKPMNRNYWLGVTEQEQEYTLVLTTTCYFLKTLKNMIDFQVFWSISNSTATDRRFIC